MKNKVNKIKAYCIGFIKQFSDRKIKLQYQLRKMSLMFLTFLGVQCFLKGILAQTYVLMNRAQIHILPMV